MGRVRKKTSATAWYVTRAGMKHFGSSTNEVRAIRHEQGALTSNAVKDCSLGKHRVGQCQSVRITLRISVAVGSPAAERQQPGAGGDSLRTWTRRAPSSGGAKACFRHSEAMNFSRPFSGGSRHRHRAAAAPQLFSKLSKSDCDFSIDPNWTAPLL